MDDSSVQLFMGLFQGRMDVWYNLTKKCVKEKVTKEHYRRHLEGEVSLGIYPLVKDEIHFFAIDIDQPDFDLARSILVEFLNLGIPLYMAKSKSKGYHLYGFLSSWLPAKIARHLCYCVLNKLGATAEVFPKQDRLTAKNIGSSINIPCFNTHRPFLGKTGDLVSLEQFLQHVRLISREDLKKAFDAVKQFLPAELVPRPAPGREGHPPCIEKILMGVGEGARDEASFALARHYLDQGYLADEVTALLETWNINNDPPMDEKCLPDKVKSAHKGYAFGCKSIVENSLLKDLCVGKDKCNWLHPPAGEKQDKKQKQERSFFESEGKMWEQVWDGHTTSFACWDGEQVTYESHIKLGESTIVPPTGAELEEQAVCLPSMAESYGNPTDLVQQLRDHIHHYLDIPLDMEEFCAWYIIMTWIYDKLPAVTYLRFMGDTTTGKSRALDIIGRLCYKATIVSGAITPAPIYRMIKRYRGTIVLDEADFRDSSEKSEVVTLLNCGFERRRPIIRCEKENPNKIDILPSFGPKCFATRYRFRDIALESRCLTHVMEPTDREDIPILLSAQYFEAETKLRNQLLMFRFENRNKVDVEHLEDIDLGNIDMRLKQTHLPFAVPFRNIPELAQRLKTFLEKRNAEMIASREDSFDGMIVHALFTLADREGKNYVTPGLISSYLQEEYKLDASQANTRRIGKVLNSLKIERVKRKMAGSLAKMFIIWNDSRMAKIKKRYIPPELEDSGTTANQPSLQTEQEELPF